MSDPKAAQLKSDLKAFATERGADGVGIVSVAAFEAKVPNLQKPSSTGLGYRSIVAFYRHMLTGAFVTRNVPLQSLNGHLALDDIERLQMELIDWLERRGHLGVAPPDPQDVERVVRRASVGELLLAALHRERYMR